MVAMPVIAMVSWVHLPLTIVSPFNNFGRHPIGVVWLRGYRDDGRLAFSSLNPPFTKIMV